MTALILKPTRYKLPGFSENCPPFIRGALSFRAYVFLKNIHFKQTIALLIIMILESLPGIQILSFLPTAWLTRFSQNISRSEDRQSNVCFEYLRCCCFFPQLMVLKDWHFCCLARRIFISWLQKDEKICRPTFDMNFILNKTRSVRFQCIFSNFLVPFFGSQLISSIRLVGLKRLFSERPVICMLNSELIDDTFSQNLN